MARTSSKAADVAKALLLKQTPANIGLSSHAQYGGASTQP